VASGRSPAPRASGWREKKKKELCDLSVKATEFTEKKREDPPLKAKGRAPSEVQGITSSSVELWRGSACATRIAFSVGKTSDN